MWIEVEKYDDEKLKRYSGVSKTVLAEMVDVM